MDLKDLDAEVQMLKEVKVFLSRLKFLGQVLFDNYIKVITGPYFTKLAWLVQLVILMHFAGLDAEFEPKVSNAWRR